MHYSIRIWMNKIVVYNHLEFDGNILLGKDLSENKNKNVF